MLPSLKQLFHGNIYYIFCNKSDFCYFQPWERIGSSTYFQDIRKSVDECK